MVEYVKRWFWRAGEKLKEFDYDAGTPTSREDVSEYEHVTIYFKSDTDGTLTLIVADPEGDKYAYDTISVTAGELEAYIISAVVEEISLKFDAAATVTAWYEAQNPQ